MIQPVTIPQNDKRALTVDDFMANYGIRRTKVYEEINSGRLRAVRAGGRTLILRTDADAWLNALPVSRPPLPAAA